MLICSKGGQRWGSVSHDPPINRAFPTSYLITAPRSCSAPPMAWPLGLGRRECRAKLPVTWTPAALHPAACRLPPALQPASHIHPVLHFLCRLQKSNPIPKYLNKIQREGSCTSYDICHIWRAIYLLLPLPLYPLIPPTGYVCVYTQLGGIWSSGDISDSTGRNRLHGHRIFEATYEVEFPLLDNHGRYLFP